MSGVQSEQFLLPKDIRHAVVAYLVREYATHGQKELGRTILQKLCYFAKVSGVPLPFRFEICHYGPFSQEIFEVTGNLVVDDVISDDSQDLVRSKYSPSHNCDALLRDFKKEVKKYKRRLDNVVETFAALDPSQMELVSTIHYIHNSYRQWHRERPAKKEVVDTVHEIKKPKFRREFVGNVYDVLLNAGLLS